MLGQAALASSQQWSETARKGKLGDRRPTRKREAQGLLRDAKLAATAVLSSSCAASQLYNQNETKNTWGKSSSANSLRWGVRGNRSSCEHVDNSYRQARSLGTTAFAAGSGSALSLGYVDAQSARLVRGGLGADVFVPGVLVAEVCSPGVSVELVLHRS